jgi:hypothetical protein
MGCGPIVDPTICKDRVIVVSSILFIILTAALICMIYWDNIITILK